MTIRLHISADRAQTSVRRASSGPPWHLVGYGLAGGGSLAIWAVILAVLPRLAT